MISLDVDVDEAVDTLNAMANRVEGRASMTLLADLVEEEQASLFASSGRGQWAANDPATVLQKGGSRVLVDSGLLLRELTAVRVAGDDVVVDAGAASEYARHLRNGARGMPKRDPSPDPSPATVTKWADALLGHIVEGRA